jgi:hypothetical protein
MVAVLHPPKVNSSTKPMNGIDQWSPKDHRGCSCSYSRNTPSSTSSTSQIAASTPFPLASTAGRRRKWMQIQETKDAENPGLIERAGVGDLQRRDGLLPQEHHSEKKHQPPTADLAREICCETLSIASGTSRKPTSTTRSSIHKGPASSPSTSLASEAVGEGRGRGARGSQATQVTEASRP